MAEDVIDWDLEVLLYSQVHYDKQQTNEEPNLVESETTSQRKEVEKDVEATKPDSPETRCKTPPPKQYLEISTSMSGQCATSPTQVVTQIPVLSTQTPNNITINQNFYVTNSFLKPFNRLKKSLRWTEKCEQHYQRLQEGLVRPTAFLTFLKKTLRNQKRTEIYIKKRQKIENSKATLASNEVICLRDSDNSDNENVERMEKSDGEGDEIIYVEPPPVPVISVVDDSGEEEEAEIDVVGVGVGQDDCADDFLGPTSTPDKENFNFSLHGCDFQDVDFARPTNPTAGDIYETESSTSTSDFNRESARNFTNTVKTVVFSEPDFPKDDIFEGDNLEKFDVLITPKRRAAQASKPREKKRKRKTPSESDYDYSQLPYLSPVERRDDKSPKKKLKRKKKRPEQESEPERKKAKRTKVKPLVEEEEKRAKKKKSKKKKRKSSEEVEEPAEDGDTAEAKIPEPSGEEERELEETDQEEEVEDIVVIEPEKKKAKRAKKKPPVEEEEKRAKKKKKKQKSSEQVEEPAEDGDTAEAKIPEPSGEEGVQALRGKVLMEEEEMELEETNQDGEVEDIVLIEPEVDPFDIESSQKKRRPEEPEPEKKKAKRAKKKYPVEEEEKRAKKKKKKKKQKSSEQVEEPAEDGDTAEAQIPEPSGEEGVQALRGKVLMEEEEVELEETNQDGEVEDIVLIEPVVPVYTIAESSSDSDGDILTSEDLSDELVLSNSKTVIKPLEAETDPFDMETLQKNMTDDPEKWKVLPADICYVPAKKNLWKKCARCRQTGHLAQNCRNKSAVPVCSLCGNKGHMEARCPNKVCFSCAKPGNYSLVYCLRCADLRRRRCGTCHQRGHPSSSCPDTWRRYHLTTEEGPLVKPDDTRQSHVKWCSGCASSGHHEHQCTSYRWNREYPTASPQICAYQELYELAESDVRNTRSTCEEVQEPAPLKFRHPRAAQRQQRYDTARGQKHRHVKFRGIGALMDVDEVPHSHSGAQNQSGLPVPPPLMALNCTNESNNVLLCSLCGNSGHVEARCPSNACFSSVPPPLMAQKVYNLRSSVHQTSHQANYRDGGEYNYRQQLLEQQKHILSRTLSLTHYNEQHSRVNLNAGQTSHLKPNYINFLLSLRPHNPPPQPQSDIFTLSSREPHPENVNIQPTPAVIPEKLRPGIPHETSSFKHKPKRKVIRALVKNYASKLNNLEEGVKQKFLTLPKGELARFLGEELKKLASIKPQEIRLFQEKLKSVERLKGMENKTDSVERQISGEFKRFNMYLFGVRRRGVAWRDEGSRHLNYLTNFVKDQGKSEGKSPPKPKRRKLRDSYGYIFGGEHPGLDYGEYFKRYVPTTSE